jgi:hypothetical protein
MCHLIENLSNLGDCCLLSRIANREPELSAKSSRLKSFALLVVVKPHSLQCQFVILAHGWLILNNILVQLRCK